MLVRELLAIIGESSNLQQVTQARYCVVHIVCEQSTSLYLDLLVRSKLDNVFVDNSSTKFTTESNHSSTSQRTICF